MKGGQGVVKGVQGVVKGGQLCEDSDVLNALSSFVQCTRACAGPINVEDELLGGKPATSFGVGLTRIYLVAPTRGLLYICIIYVLEMLQWY